MRKEVVSRALVVALCLLAPVLVKAQEPQADGNGSRKARITELRKELEALEKQAEIERLEALQKETNEKLQKLKAGAAPPAQTAAQPMPEPEPDDKPAPKQEEKSNAGSRPTTQTPAPSAAAAMPGPTQRDVVLSLPQPLPRLGYGVLDPANAALFNSKYAYSLIKEAISSEKGKIPVLRDADKRVPDINDKKFHCILHVLRWGDVDAKSGKPQEVEKQNWYLYNNGSAKGFNGKWSQEDFAKNSRIYGVDKVWILYVHLNKQASSAYQARYEFDITKKTPANLNNLFLAAQLFVSIREESGEDPEDVWGGGAVEIDYVPSDVTVTAKYVRIVLDETDELRDDAAIARGLRGSEPIALDEPKTFDNEGLYWWDVSVGVPIKRISQLQFESTANTVTAQKVDKQNIFALVNLYPFPVDVKKRGFNWVPHFVGGVAIAKQPQNKILVGAGFGPYFANFYLGALFVKERETQTLQEGDMASPDALNSDLRTRYKSQFTFGLNLPVRGIIEALKPKENSK